MLLESSIQEGENPKPFYISLYMGGYKLNNCIIDLGASDNVMPLQIMNSLGLSCMKNHDKCYSLESKSVPLVGQLKDVQVRLESFLEKKIMMTILIAGIPISYGMLLRKSFYKDLRGEIQLDWSYVTTPLKKGSFKLEPKAKLRFTVVKYQDPQAQVLYQHMGPGTYAMLSEVTKQEKFFAYATQTLNEDSKMWTMQFDGSCSTTGLREKLVITSLEVTLYPFSYHLQFNDNKTILHNTRHFY